MKEKTEEEIKSSPAFHRAFYNECRKNATNEAEKQQIDKFFRESQTHEDFNVKMFEIDWYLEKYEEILNESKQLAAALIRKEEEAAMIISRIFLKFSGQEAEIKQVIPPMQKVSYTPPVKQEPTVPIANYYSQSMMSHNQPMKPSYTSSMDYRMQPEPREPTYYTPSQQQPIMQTQPQTQHQPQSSFYASQRPTYFDRGEDKTMKEYRPQAADLSQLKQKLSSIIQLNYASVINQIKKTGKEPTEGFLSTLYLAVSDYVRNLFDDLRSIAEAENDSTDLKSFMRTGDTSELDSQRHTLIPEKPSDASSSYRQLQFLIKFSSIQEDQKQIEKINEREQKDLEEKYALSKEEDEEKVQKKIKKDFTEQDELIKLLFKSKKDKSQDSENKSKKIQETNLFLSNLTSRTTSNVTPSQTQEALAQKEHISRGRKAGAGQKRITMKHLVYYLETNPLYRRTPLLHKAYLK